MNKDLEKFRTLLLTDTEFQKKLKTAAEAYTGDQSEEAVFNNVLVPIATEYNITATYDEFKAYIFSLENTEMSQAELQQVAGGGKNEGNGVVGCYVIGVGLGGGNSDGAGGGCAYVGFGWGEVKCSGEGSRYGY